MQTAVKKDLSQAASVSGNIAFIALNIRCNILFGSRQLELALDRIRAISKLVAFSAYYVGYEH